LPKDCQEIARENSAKTTAARGFLDQLGVYASHINISRCSLTISRDDFLKTSANHPHGEFQLDCHEIARKIANWQLAKCSLLVFHAFQLPELYLPIFSVIVERGFVETRNDSRSSGFGEVDFSLFDVE
jgi:hypothetical protein